MLRARASAACVKCMRHKAEADAHQRSRGGVQASRGGCIFILLLSRRAALRCCRKISRCGLGGIALGLSPSPRREADGRLTASGTRLRKAATGGACARLPGTQRGSHGGGGRGGVGMGSTGRRLQQKSEQESRSVSVEGRKEESRIIPSLNPDTHIYPPTSDPGFPPWVGDCGKGCAAR